MPATTDTNALLPPRYDDVRPLAHGGMGQIFRARDRELDRDVAVKLLAERYAQDETLRHRFRREALAAARLSSNPNIVTIFDVAEHNGRPMIVMEYVEGGSLEELADGPSPGQVLAWLDEAAAALDAAHAAGVVHRDVKPGNLLLDGRGHVKVADFGVASAAGLDSFTQAGTILGTAGYLSPEQARGERAGPASDRYALAVVAYELLTGSRPFERGSPTAEATAHATTRVPSAHAMNPSLPRAFDRIFERALAKDPGNRYPTAAAFVADLRRELEEDTPDSWTVLEHTTPRTIAPPPRPSSTRPLLIGLVVLFALLAAGGILAAVLATRGGNQSGASGPPTVVRTVTGPGRTVLQTVTVQPTPARAPTTAPATAAVSGSSGADLNNTAYAKMRAGDYAGALPLLEQAVQKLNGTGQIDEAYADFNLAYTRYQLGDCTDVLALLDRSQSIQGHRSEINHLRKDARKTCGD
jgi:eukaryotic-like serine/threonine-protein kinase